LIKSLSILPRAGLGNKMFSWASGAIFAKVNNAKHEVYGLTRIHLGPWYRNEKSKRLYRNLFTNERFFKPFFLNLNKVNYVGQSNCNQIVNSSGYYIFNEIPHWSNYFETIKNHRPFLLKYLDETLNPLIKKKVKQLSSPEIAVHIRLGDFKDANTKNQFELNGGIRTPIDYFINTIHRIRSFCGYNIPVTIFTDGSAVEIKELFNLENITMAEANADMVQLLHMSKSKLIILSATSTYGKWAGFLSDAIIIDHHIHFHGPTRLKDDCSYYDGPIHASESIGKNVVLSHSLKKAFNSKNIE
jgi:hypothetical protein